MDELMHSGKYISFEKYDSVTVWEDEKEIEMTLKEFNVYFYEKLYNGGIKYRINYIWLNTEEELVEAIDNGSSVRIYISK